MRKVLLLSVLLWVMAVGYSQEDNPYKIDKLRLEARIDYEGLIKDDTSANSGGFAGKFINFAIDGHLTHRFSYHYRQRLNIADVTFSSFFRGCDWLYLDYHLGKHFTFSAGKQVVYIGGFEYDYAPIDVFYWSRFWNNVVCYEMGASVAFHDTAHKHTLIFQVCNSPFVSKPFENIYAYNLIWYGNMGVFSTIYSLNLIEYTKNHYITYISLGNKFTFNNLSFYIDFQNRASFAQKNFLFKDITLIGQVDYRFNHHWKLFIKGGYDVNHAQDAATGYQMAYDQLVLPGEEYYYCGIGGFYYPLNNDMIRLHAFFAVNHLDYTTYQLNAGVTWKMDFLQAFKYLKEQRINKDRRPRKGHKILETNKDEN